MGVTCRHSTQQHLSMWTTLLLLFPTLLLGSNLPYPPPPLPTFGYPTPRSPYQTPSCQLVNETECTQVEVEKCTVETKEVCLTVTETECSDVEEEKCIEIEVQECETVTENVCNAVNETLCAP